MRHLVLLLPLVLLGTIGVATAAEPKAIYQGTCIACHGPTARGAIPGIPDLVKSGRLARPMPALVESIMKGMQTAGSPLAMPPKGGNPDLTPVDAEALVTYMRALSTK